jgi:putative addiction module CopG family antidote
VVAYALEGEQKQFVDKLIRSGRFHNPDEVVREALRRMEESELSYLAPPPLTEAQIQNIYCCKGEESDSENSFGKGAFEAVRRAAKKDKAG